MRFYQIQHMGDFHFEHGEWFTTRKEAEKALRDYEKQGVPMYDLRTFDIPTKKKELLDWLNIFGNPSGMGGC